jgi:hypothetical protein
MHAVCVGHGYCGGVHGNKFMHVTDFIPQSGNVTADQFVEWVFQAEYENESERVSHYMIGIAKGYETILLSIWDQTLSMPAN